MSFIIQLGCGASALIAQYHSDYAQGCYWLLMMIMCRQSMPTKGGEQIRCLAARGEARQPKGGAE